MLIFGVSEDFWSCVACIMMSLTVDVHIYYAQRKMFICRMNDTYCSNDKTANPDISNQAGDADLDKYVCTQDCKNNECNSLYVFPSQMCAFLVPWTNTNSNRTLSILQQCVCVPDTPLTEACAKSQPILHRRVDQSAY